MEKRRICLYTQTHWDREWYWEFEKYRCQLGSVARQLAAELEEGAMPVFISMDNHAPSKTSSPSSPIWKSGSAS